METKSFVSASAYRIFLIAVALFTLVFVSQTTWKITPLQGGCITGGIFCAGMMIWYACKSNWKSGQ